jgi:histidine ammonia-lyase
MAAHGARRLLAMAANLSRIVGIEMVCAAQGVGFRAPLATAAPLAAAMARLRADVPPLVEDRALDGDLEAAALLVRDGALVRATGVPPPRLAPDDTRGESTT